MDNFFLPPKVGLGGGGGGGAKFNGERGMKKQNFLYEGENKR